MYAEGVGVAKDEPQAYFWWLLASAQDDAAGRNRDLVAERLTAAQRDEAQAKARDWKQK